MNNIILHTNKTIKHLILQQKLKLKANLHKIYF